MFAALTCVYNLSADAPSDDLLTAYAIDAKHGRYRVFPLPEQRFVTWVGYAENVCLRRCSREEPCALMQPIAVDYRRHTVLAARLCIAHFCLVHLLKCLLKSNCLLKRNVICANWLKTTIFKNAPSWKCGSLPGNTHRRLRMLLQSRADGTYKFRTLIIIQEHVDS